MMGNDAEASQSRTGSRFRGATRFLVDCCVGQVRRLTEVVASLEAALALRQQRLDAAQSAADLAVEQVRSLLWVTGCYATPRGSCSGLSDCA